VFVELAKKGELEPGSVLDIGCGTGENAILLAGSGYTVTGVDAAPIAIDTAKAKAKARNVNVEFLIRNALDLNLGQSRFDNAIDSGLFHTFHDNERPVYAKEVAKSLRDGGKYFMMCFSENEPTNWGGPRRVSRAEIQETFSSLFKISYIHDALFATRIHDKGGKGYLTSATKLENKG
jgi:cyclopropane fatty-acyl-phospholipid synthase-like methyltransferase